MLQQLIRAGRLDRTLYDELVFDDYATGNAVLIVAAVFGIPPLLASLTSLDGILVVLNSVLSGIIRWLLTAVVVWAMATKVFESERSNVQTTVRLVGFAHVAFLPATLSAFAPDLRSLLTLVSLVWFFFGLRTVAQILFDLEPQHAMATAAVGVAAWWVLALLAF